MDPGLCGHCRHVQVLRNERGSVFYFCGLANTDTRFTRYPPLPVRTCPGYAPQVQRGDSSSSTSSASASPES